MFQLFGKSSTGVTFQLCDKKVVMEVCYDHHTTASSLKFSKSSDIKMKLNQPSSVVIVPRQIKRAFGHSTSFIVPYDGVQAFRGSEDLIWKTGTFRLRVGESTELIRRLIQTLLSRCTPQPGTGGLNQHVMGIYGKPKLIK